MANTYICAVTPTLNKKKDKKKDDRNKRINNGCCVGFPDSGISSQFHSDHSSTHISVHLYYIDFEQGHTVDREHLMMKENRSD
jgi:hypothetical protein